MRSSYGFELRLLLAGTLLTASLICVALAANPREDCVDRMLQSYVNCLYITDGHGNYKYSVAYCQRRANNLWASCLRSAGVIKSSSNATPPSFPTNVRPVGPPASAGNKPKP